MAESEIGRPVTGWSGAWARLTTAPSYEPSVGDLRTVSVLGLDLPLRATVALLVVVTAISLDWSRTFIPREILDLNKAAPAIRYQALERLVLFGLVPLAVVVGLFRDRPTRYGLTVGDWRVGLPMAAIGIAVMTPIVLVLARLPAFQAFYGQSTTNVADLLVTNLIDIPPSEFLIRGFLMFTLLRRIGPLAVVVATLPFVFAHLSKPELELLSTFFGGLAYGWLSWRTGSIVWSATAHVAIATILLAAVGAART
jgi:membrane protease YdiL (CAAX protease family)